VGCGVKIRLTDGSGTIDLNNLYSDRDRHGKTRFYYRSRGKKTRLREDVGSPAFLDEYRRARAGMLAISEPQIAQPQTLRWLVEQYYKSSDFLGLSESTRSMRRRVLDNFCQSLQNGKPRGSLAYAHMQRKHVKQVRDERAATPEAANNLIKFIRHMFSWAIEAGYVEQNPALNMRRLQSNSTGHHTFTTDEIAQYCRHFPLGTRERLALELLLLTGTRVSDACRLGRQMERRGWLYFTEVKGEKRYNKKRELPILPRLRTAIDACPSGNMTYIVTAFGKPFTAKGFSNWFKDNCIKAGLEHCSAHGLRKAGATIAAMNGATPHELMAIFGWLTLSEAQRYTREADRRAMTQRAMAKVDPLYSGQETGGSLSADKGLK